MSSFIDLHGYFCFAENRSLYFIRIICVIRVPLYLCIHGRMAIGIKPNRRLRLFALPEPLPPMTMIY